MKILWAFLILLLTAILPDIALAQDAGPLNINLGDDLLSSRRLFQLIIVITVLSLAPSILMMVTSFTRIVVVFSFLRSAMGLQASPPNTVLISLAFFLTLFIMQPTLEEAYSQGVGPFLNQEINEEQAFTRTVDPFRSFMLSQVRETDLDLFLNMLEANERPDPDNVAAALGGDAEQRTTVPLRALIPAFMISELRRAFEIGFLIFLPFLVIDLAVASILMSMGMMMLPPVMISLPFKIIFFVLVDGWNLLSGSLVQSFGAG